MQRTLLDIRVTYHCYPRIKKEPWNRNYASIHGLNELCNLLSAHLPMSFCGWYAQDTRPQDQPFTISSVYQANQSILRPQKLQPLPNIRRTPETNISRVSTHAHYYVNVAGKQMAKTPDIKPPSVSFTNVLQPQSY